MNEHNMNEIFHPLKRFDASPAITTKRTLLTTAWTADVKVLQDALSRCKVAGRLDAGCEVAFFEVAGDSQLHVNVIHGRQTLNMTGWTGPHRATDGLTHERTFSRMARYQILRQIREMVFASPL